MTNPKSFITLTHSGGQYMLDIAEHGTPFLLYRALNSDGTITDDWSEVDFQCIDEPLADIGRLIMSRLEALNAVWREFEATKSIDQMQLDFDVSCLDDDFTANGAIERVNDRCLIIHGFYTEYVEKQSVYLDREQYAQNDATCLSVRAANGDPLMRITVCLDQPPPVGTLWVKEWSENAGVVEALQRCGFLTKDEPVEFYPSGHVLAAAYRVSSAYLDFIR